MDEQIRPQRQVACKMIFYYRKGQYRTVSLFAARSSLTPWLIVSEHPDATPQVFQRPFSGNACLTDDEIRAAVATGTAEANTQYGTLLFPTEIKIMSDGGNDSVERGAFFIIERLATRGDAGFELLK